MFDSDNDGFLSKEEFHKGLNRFFPETFEKSMRLIFDLFDFDSDGKISKEDVRILLSYIPLAQVLNLDSHDIGVPMNSEDFIEKTQCLYIDRLESQEELTKLLERCMKKPTMIFSEFAEMTENVSSTIFLCVYIF